MVAVIKAGHSLSRILRYNEEKVTNGAASFLGEGNCPFENTAVGLMAKLNYLERIAALNSKVSSPSIHISLNFPPAEQGLADGRLLEIARTYMDGIGFGSQPWLAYRHTDAGHPHLHIVSLKVRPDGSRIDMHNIGRNASEATRQEIEQKFGLIPASRHSRELGYTPEPITAARVAYGNAPTKKAIANVIRFALEQYRFKSLAELNALLGLYNIRADRGKVTSRTYLAGGLLYRALDTAGRALGVPIKASDFYFKPTLERLEKEFAKNAVQKDKSADHLRTAIDRVITKGNVHSLSDLQALLKPLGIDMVIRHSAAGQAYGVTFIDHKDHEVINGSDLGKTYSAKGLERRLGIHLREDTLRDQPSVAKAPPYSPTGNTATIDDINNQTGMPSTGNLSPLDLLLQPQQGYEYTANGFNGSGKKKKKRKGRR